MTVPAMTEPDGMLVEISMTPDELKFLEGHLRPTDHVFEWGAGWSTVHLARLVRRYTAVEHSRAWALKIMPYIRPNTSLLYIPPDKPWLDDATDDGDGVTFANYVNAYMAAFDDDVVIIDGRARVDCAIEVAANNTHDSLRCVFLHDAERPEYAPIWTVMDEMARVGRMVLMKVRNKVPKGEP